VMLAFRGATMFGVVLPPIFITLLLIALVYVLSRANPVSQ